MPAAKPKALLAGIHFPEGPRWRKGKLWFSDIVGRTVTALDLEGQPQVVLALVDARPSGLGFLPDGTLLIVSVQDLRLLRLGRDGKARPYADLKGLASSLNDMVVDGLGRAYVGTRRDEPGGAWPEGEVILATPDGKARVVASALYGPNGMAVSGDGRTLVVAEYIGQRLTAFTIAKDGSLSKRRVFAETPGRRPDGICMDAEGAVWFGSPMTNEFLRVGDGGRVLQRINLKDRRGIACVLGGPDRRTLFLCTSRVTWEDLRQVLRDPKADRGACRGWIETVDVAVPGAGWP